jgi:hypothetical protein
MSKIEFNSVLSDSTFFEIRAGQWGFIDIYNLANSNAEQNITVSSGANWLRPINIIPPRVMRLGVKYDW